MIEMFFGVTNKMNDFLKNLTYRLKNKIRISGKNNKIIVLSKTKIKKNFIEILGNNNTLKIDLNSEIKESEIIIHAENSVLTIGEDNKIKKTKISIDGVNNQIKLSDKVRIENSYFYMNDSDSSITIGEGSTFEGVKVNSQENNNKIQIGDNCMFSYNVEIRNTDSHPIFNENNEILNRGKEVIIGNMVWLGEGTTILKGVSIANGCVVGAKSLVTKNIREIGSVSAGIPSKVIKKNIIWGRKFI